ncbi:hypothetical protein EO244_16605 [Ancylomarina salipaludis]|uniref:Uncharacterized protein n=1 Tax=Ancylomarina salipaludis TaxID=2501299 RepID=A0A4V1MZP8_9BACT|nr:hypothetical protein [Ancylomarina salipaludis]RXQ87261.1 hypothetical protein EO244_16605 [Ancylomarina salipaludis]
MQINKTLHSFIRLIILILLSLKLIAGGFQQIDYIQNFLPSWDLAFNLEIILRKHLYIHSFLVFIGIIGVFINRRLGLVLMLIFPFWVISDALIAFIFPMDFIWYVNEYRLIVAIILVVLVNSLQLIQRDYSLLIKRSFFLNGIAFSFGLLISSGIWYLYERLMI